MLRIPKLLAAVMALVLLFAVPAFAEHGHFPYTATVKGWPGPSWPPDSKASTGDKLSTVVRAQTLSVLEGLDPERKRILLLFLERVMASIRKALGIGEREIGREPSRPCNPHFYAVFA